MDDGPHTTKSIFIKFDTSHLKCLQSFNPRSFLVRGSRGATWRELSFCHRNRPRPTKSASARSRPSIRTYYSFCHRDTSHGQHLQSFISRSFYVRRLSPWVIGTRSFCAKGKRGGTLSVLPSFVTAIATIQTLCNPLLLQSKWSDSRQDWLANHLLFLFSSSAPTVIVTVFLTSFSNFLVQ